MAENFWMDNAMQTGKHTLVDLGYLASGGTMVRAEQLVKRIGKGNFQLAPNDRLLARIPPAKVETVLAEFPDIRPASERRGYCWCTHTWIDADGADLKHARY